MKIAPLVPRQRVHFLRTQFTWLAYVSSGYNGYLQAAVGPLMPFLRSELHLSYSMEGLHFSAFALGTILAGVSGDYVIRLWGRRRVFWLGGAGMATAAIALIAGRHPVWTLLSIVLMGYTGNLLRISTHAALSDAHGEQRSIALLEANLAAAVGAALTPFAISLLQEAGFGWRCALVFMVCIFVLLFVLGRRIAIPSVEAAETKKQRAATGLRKAFWAYWSAVLVGVGDRVVYRVLERRLPR